jgi:aldose 1-epimerase
MPFAVRSQIQPAAPGLDARTYLLEDDAGNRAEVWPALGFNCFRWQTPLGGRTLDLLYADPNLFTDGRPTRSGIPILFPFPNRVRVGRFTWDGKDYQLPLNDNPPRNAIHGFACRRAWRVVDHGATESAAWVTGEFHGLVDAPDCRDLWPADYNLRVSYHLGAGSLRIEAEVTNPDTVLLPFGLGYHPYFRMPFASGGKAEDCTIQVPARSYWQLADLLPTGKRQPVDAARDLNVPRRFGDLTLDDVLTDLPERAPEENGLIERAVLGDDSGAVLRLSGSPAFREMVVFTPPNRQAFCVEPYTCPTDAINLQARGVETGWQALPPGGRWSAVVELRVTEEKGGS